MNRSIGLKRLGQHTVVYAVGIVLGRLVSFVLLPLYTHFLTPADYGVMQLVELTLDIVSIFAGSQLAGGVFRFYHKASSDEERAKVLSTSMSLLMTSFGSFALAAILLAEPLSQLVFGSTAQAGLVRIAATSLALQSVVVVPLAQLRLQERSLHYTYISIGKLVLQLTLNIVFVAGLKLNVRGIFLSTLITNAVLAVVLGAPFARKVGFGVSQSWMKALLRYGLPLIGVNMATFISTFGDRYFLRAHASMTVVGLYALAYQFGFLMFSLGYMPFSMIWEPARFEIIKRADRDELLSRAFLYLNVLLVSIAVGISLFVGDFLKVMSSPAYLPAATLVPLILLAYVLQGWATFQEIGILVGERTELLTLISWLSAAAAIIGYALLIPRWLGVGAALATILAFATRASATYVIAQRILPIRYGWAPVARLMLLASAYALIGVFSPRMDFVWSLSWHAFLFFTYLVALWNFGVFAISDRDRIRALIRSPRRELASFLT